MLACIVGNDLDGILLADELTVEAVLAVFNILEDGLLVFRVPANDVDEAGFVAKLAADALLGEKVYAMISIDQNTQPPS